MSNFGNVSTSNSSNDEWKKAFDNVTPDTGTCEILAIRKDDSSLLSSVKFNNLTASEITGIFIGVLGQTLESLKDSNRLMVLVALDKFIEEQVKKFSFAKASVQEK